MEYDFAVFIGRFQPYHKGHHHVATEALKIAKNLIFVIGSHDKPRDVRNPFTTDERRDIIQECFPMGSPIFFVPQVDYTYNEERWIASIQASVSTIVFRNFRAGPVKIAIIGYEKDHSSYYLKKFPQWDLITIEPKFAMDATRIRTQLFDLECDMTFVEPNVWADEKNFCNENHRAKVIEFAKPIAGHIKDEFCYIRDYRDEWGNGPFVTVDSVVTQAGHILLVERGGDYGVGQWALPGGFINSNETLLDAALRELREETVLKVPKPVLVGSIAKIHTYDDPHRSNRARIISQAYHFRLNDMEEGLPKVKGSDDAARAFWVPFSEFVKSRSKMFEDHFCMVSHMLGI